MINIWTNLANLDVEFQRCRGNSSRLRRLSWWCSPFLTVPCEVYFPELNFPSSSCRDKMKKTVIRIIMIIIPNNNKQFQQSFSKEKGSRSWIIIYRKVERNHLLSGMFSLVVWIANWYPSISRWESGVYFLDGYWYPYQPPTGLTWSAVKSLWIKWYPPHALVWRGPCHGSNTSMRSNFP